MIMLMVGLGGEPRSHNRDHGYLVCIQVSPAKPEVGWLSLENLWDLSDLGWLDVDKS
jgi:hypothetical protein